MGPPIVWITALCIASSALASEPPTELELMEDAEDARDEHGYLGRISVASIGAQTGILPKSLSLDDETAPEAPPAPVGASRHIPLSLWLQLSVPLLRTRYGTSFGIESQSTIGVNFARDLEPRRALVWSTRWLAALTIDPLDIYMTFFAGAELGRHAPYWWTEPEERSTHGAFGMRINTYSGDSAIELGYSYQPLLSTPSREVTIAGQGGVGAPTHVAHRVWLEPGIPFRLSYVHHVMRFAQEEQPTLRAHQLLVTVHIP